MFIALALADTLNLAASASADVIVGASSTNNFATQIRNFIAPLFLLAIGIAALSFLFRRQVTEFLQFAALAVGIAVFFYVPGIVETTAKFFAGFLK